MMLTSQMIIDLLEATRLNPEYISYDEAVKLNQDITDMIELLAMYPFSIGRAS
ncbi:hypothetical protein LCGC14_3057190 [marine sediment metagenome]|uniref:Uncharacterized protein n=1 Tax=marine sediment metagenome TaxID=412755 RepID=A0A0F8ZAR4_9ZZZZ